MAGRSSSMRAFFRSLGRSLFGRRRFEAELDAELRAWLEQVADEKIAAGMSPAEAWRRARIELGGVEPVKEEVRAVRAGALLEATLQDLRYAARSLARSPGFTVAVVLTLALGIGVNTAIFGVVDAFMLRPLPVVRAPGELVWLRRSSSYPSFLDYRDQSRELFSGMAALGGAASFSLDAGGRVDVVRGEPVSAGAFEVLGVEPALGRWFVPEDDCAGAEPVAIVSHALWQSRFGGDAALVGRTIRVNGAALRVVGVAPRGFIGAEVGLARDLWVPLALFPRLGAAGDRDAGADLFAARDTSWLNVIARLAPGVRLAEADAAMAAIAGRIAANDPHRDERVSAAGLLPVVGGLDPRDRLGAVLVATLLMAVVGMVLLVACSNVAGLVMARAATRVKEMGVRRALGAGRGRLVRQLLTESLLLALLGGGAGLLLAGWTDELLAAVARATPIAPPEVRLDARVLGFTAAISVVTAFVFGLAPALSAARVDVMSALRCERPGFRRSRLRRALVVAQVAASLVLLVAAGLLARSLGNARGVDPGFAVENGLLVPVAPGSLGMGEERGREVYARVAAAVAATPGVERVTLMHDVPLGLDASMIQVAAGEAAGDDRVLAGFDIVGPGYLAAMGIPLARGRDLEAADGPGAPRVAVVNESLARRLFADAEPLGRIVTVSGAGVEIVGVARDSKTRSLGERERGQILFPLGQRYRGTMTLLARTRTDAAAMATAVQAAIHDVEPRLPGAGARTLAGQVDLALLPARLGTLLLGGFGVLALALTAIGVYALVAFAVRGRTREIGIRVALGASRRAVLGLVLQEALAVVAVGVAVGLALALAAARLIAGFLYGLAPTDPATFLGIPLALLTVAAVAAYLPARRALRVEPQAALREE